MAELRVELAAEAMATLEREAAVQGRPAAEVAANVLEVVAHHLRLATFGPVDGTDTDEGPEGRYAAAANDFTGLGEVLVRPQVWQAVEADYQASLRDKPIA